MPRDSVAALSPPRPPPLINPASEELRADYFHLTRRSLPPPPLPAPTFARNSRPPSLLPRGEVGIHYAPAPLLNSVPSLLPPLLSLSGFLVVFGARGLPRRGGDRGSLTWASRYPSRCQGLSNLRAYETRGIRRVPLAAAARVAK